MATDTKQTWGQRSKKTSVIALGLVAILAGVAVAYFLTTQDFENNFAKGGELTVNADMDLDFTGGGATCQTPTGTPAPDGCNVLYPTNDANGGTDGAALVETFTITNDNPVKTSYILWATCPGCTDNTLGDAAQQLDQYDSLMIKIDQVATAATGTGAITCGVNNSCPTDAEVYNGLLSAMTAADFANLGEIAAGGSKAFKATLWLANDVANEQPQMVLSQWTFHVGATLPAPTA